MGQYQRNKHLSQKQITCTVLEARHRIGGRVFSHQMDEGENLVVELGAEWVGASHQRLISLCEENHLTLDNNQFSTHLVYKGKYFSPAQWDYTEDWKKKFHKLLQDYTTMSDSQKLALDKIDWWRYLVNNGCEGRDLDLRELLDSTDFGESIRHVSAFAALAEYAESSEKNEMDYKIRGGNALLAHKLADTIGRQNILTDHRVQQIIQNKKGVEVICQNGRHFSADKIICTLPTFALRRISWLPLLPDTMISALDELQYARINKNPLLFSNRFWKEENFDMVTDQSAHYFYHATKNQASAKGVLISYTIGDKADVVSRQNEEWRQAMLRPALYPAFGDVMPFLEKQANYYWGEDEYSRGAYALYKPGQWFRLKPLLSRDFMHTSFAGEHLADWQGFMEGAIITGEEAADKM